MTRRRRDRGSEEAKTCKEWLYLRHHLESMHQWEHGRDGGPLQCSRCGADYQEFDHRARTIQDDYLEAYS
jgi:hypothetical protein